MVNAGRVAMAWIAVIITFLVILMLYTVLSPQIELWASVVADFTGVTYNSALQWTDLSWRVVPIIVEGGVIGVGSNNIVLRRIPIRFR